MLRGPVAIIANPTSGRGRGIRFADSIAKALRERGIDTSVIHTIAPGDAQTIAAQLCRSTELPECIVACGGDGTIQQIAGAIAAVRNRCVTGEVNPSPSKGEGRVRVNDTEAVSRGHSGQRSPLLALAPCGRCNDFARAFGIKPNIRSIVQTLLTGECREMDLGKANGRYFCTVATVGIDAAISDFVDRTKLPIKGTPAYLYGAVRMLMSYRAPLITLEGDFGLIRQRAFLTSLANTSSYGGAITLVPHADPADGTLDVCIIDHISRLKALQLIPIVLAGRHRTHKNVRFLATSSLRIDADRTLELWADGERLTTTPAIIEVVPRAIILIVPGNLPE